MEVKSASLETYMKPFELVSKWCIAAGVQISGGGSYLIRWFYRIMLGVLFLFQVCSFVFNFDAPRAPRNLLYIGSAVHASCYLLLESGGKTFQDLNKLTETAFSHIVQVRRRFRFTQDLDTEVKIEQKMAWVMFKVWGVIMFGTSSLLLIGVFFKGKSKTDIEGILRR